jgi:hypothetical protein
MEDEECRRRAQSESKDKGNPVTHSADTFLAPWLQYGLTCLEPSDVPSRSEILDGLAKCGQGISPRRHGAVWRHRESRASLIESFSTENLDVRDSRDEVAMEKGGVNKQERRVILAV